ncbi:PREDICTED: zinc finger protein 800 [Polistes dominula]|uniref:Zinc finger protein 800 n=1 Tax=Polistes dominula TaxID=743375 RepID=A0ABM1JD12_POLDO|nr:PREDICTED: zinc finger protein 800 [Polistes dominula]
MKSMKAKSKNKKNNAKFGKLKFGTKETNNVISPDLSTLRKPIDISVSRLSQICKLLENGSDEVKAILAYECDIIYECRVCRSLFRSLVNFISHKRVYCKDKFNITLNKNIFTDDDEAYTNGSFIRLHIPEEENVKEICNNDRILRSQVPKEENKKDLTTIIEMLQKKQNLLENSFIQETEFNKNCNNFNPRDSNNDVVQDGVDKSEVSIVYQTDDMNKEQNSKLQSMINQSTGVLGPNGQLLEKKDLYEDNNSIPSLVNDEDNAFLIDSLYNRNLICSICNAKFSTKKTLTFHMKTLHTSHRMSYPCPCCTSTFVNTWSVYRHLFKIHKMSNEQVRKLRMQIQEKAFRKEITQTDDTEQNNANTKTCEIVDLQATNETREWMNQLESDSELQRCGGCGKRFDRKAALFSHSQHCQRRIAACNEAKIKEKKAAKTTTNSNNIPNVPVIAETPPEITELNETSIRVENIITLSDADWDMIGNENSNDSRCSDVVSVSSSSSASPNQESFNNSTKKDSSPSHNTTESPEIVYTSEIITVKNGSKKRKLVADHTLKISKDITEKTKSNNSSKNISRTLNSSSAPSKNQLDLTTIMENKIATIANLRKLQCLPCKRKFTSMTNLRRHMAIHIGWNRYRCKLCDFKCFAKYDCVAHCNKIHNAQNNRALLTEMVLEISQDKYIDNEDIVINETNTEENINESESNSLSNTIDHNKTKNVSMEKYPKNVVNINIDNKEAGTKEVPCSSEKDNSVSIKVNNENNNTSNFSKNSESFQTGNLDTDLKRMVMRVIFGTPDECSLKQQESETSSIESNTSPDKKVDSKESKTELNRSNLTIQDSKDSNSSTSPDNLKPQRPIRNRVKPVDKDFIYDLKEVAFRKELLLNKGTSCKALNRKSLVRLHIENENSDILTEQPSSKDSLTSVTLPLEQDNNADKIDIKKRAINTKSTLMKFPRVPHFTQQAEITLIEEK